MTASEALDQVSKQFSAWRKDKSNGRETPDTLKLSVIQLVGQLPISQVTRRLGLSHSAIKSWQNEHLQTPSMSFVEVPSPVKTAVSHQLSVTFNGQTLTLNTDMPPPALGQLIGSLIQQQSQSLC